MENKRIIIIIAAASATVIIFWFAIKLPRIKKKCHREGFEAGVKFAENIEKRVKQVKQKEDSNKSEKIAVLIQIRMTLVDFEKEFKEICDQKKEIQKNENLSSDEKLRRINKLDQELENWLVGKGMV